jgi:hypothetical protein
MAAVYAAGRVRLRPLALASLAPAVWLAASVLAAAIRVAALHEVSLRQALDTFAAQWDYAAVMSMFITPVPLTPFVWLGFAAAAYRGWRASAATD